MLLTIVSGTLFFRFFIFFAKSASLGDYGEQGSRCASWLLSSSFPGLYHPSLNAQSMGKLQYGQPQVESQGTNPLAVPRQPRDWVCWAHLIKINSLEVKFNSTIQSYLIAQTTPTRFILIIPRRPLPLSIGNLATN